MKYSHIYISLIAGAASGYAVDLSVWLLMRDGLIAFMGLISAALLQLIPVTTNFLANDELTPDEARSFSGALREQQNFWVGMLSVSVTTVIVLVLSTILNPAIANIPQVGDVDFSWVLSGLIGGLLSFVLALLVLALRGVLSLQRLRSVLVIAAADRRARESAEKTNNLMTPPKDIVPADYGKVIQPPSLD